MVKELKPLSAGGPRELNPATRTTNPQLKKLLVKVDKRSKMLTYARVERARCFHGARRFGAVGEKSLLDTGKPTEAQQNPARLLQDQATFRFACQQWMTNLAKKQQEVLARAFWFLRGILFSTLEGSGQEIGLTENECARSSGSST